MSLDQPEIFESRPSAFTSDPAREAEDEKDHGTVSLPLIEEQIRGIIRLIQCRQCSLPLRDPITLPCGRSLCRACLPESRARENISYPATPGRLQGFDCPFPECGRTHAMGDCGADVVLSKAINHFREEMKRARASSKNGADLATRLVSQEALRPTAVLSLSEGDPKMRDEDSAGSRLVATFVRAESGNLEYDSEMSIDDVEAACQDEPAPLDQALYMKVKESVRTEMDCQVCYALFYDPLTTVCGHTFCRSCLHRVLDHSFYCPICRRGLSISPLLHRQSCPSNEYITKIINTFWADAVLTRGDALAAEALNRHREFDIPVFVCTLSFPMMPTFLHIFEPRYRLMIRRALEGDRTFGMVLPRRPRHADEAGYVEYGTLLRIVNAEYFADGRSLIETQGISRFKILRSGNLDGYMVGKIERVDDVSIAEEEEMEAQETYQEHQEEDEQPLTHSTSWRSELSGGSASGVGGGGSSARATSMEGDVRRMQTSELLDFAVSFVNRMHRQSVPWLAQRMLTIYGECPSDAARFPWWFASILPAKESEKYKLLETTSVRQRLKICCAWIMEWEANRWASRIDPRPGLSPAAGSSDADQRRSPA